jgi:hypothetical protein
MNNKKYFFEMSGIQSLTDEQTSNFVFRARTKDGHIVKLLGELIHNTGILQAPFIIDNEGIKLSAADANAHQLINFTLYRENFQMWKCTKPLYFHVNATHFHRMVKTIKKKDYITIYIKDDDVCKLCFCVETIDEAAPSFTNIHIQYCLQPQVFSVPEGYPAPTTCTKAEYQKMKMLQIISKQMIVTSPYPGLMYFFCDGGVVYDRKVVLGSEYQDEEIKKEAEEFRQTFSTSKLTSLTKCANQSTSNIKIYCKKNLPLKIKMTAASLGDLVICIKSDERIALEQKMEAEKTRMKKEGEE